MQFNSAIKPTGHSLTTTNKLYFLYHSDEWWRDTWPLSSVHVCRPERVGCHQPCWLYLYMYECTEWCSNWCTIIMYQCLLLGSQWYWFTRYLTVSKWPLAQARESGVSPAVLAVPVHVRVYWVMQQLMYHNYVPMLTFRITMILVHKVLDCVQVTISTDQREWGVTSLVDWLCGRPPSTT